MIDQSILGVDKKYRSTARIRLSVSVLQTIIIKTSIQTGRESEQGLGRNAFVMSLTEIRWACVISLRR